MTNYEFKLQIASRYYAPISVRKIRGKGLAYEIVCQPYMPPNFHYKGEVKTFRSVGRLEDILRNNFPNLRTN